MPPTVHFRLIPLATPPPKGGPLVVVTNLVKTEEWEKHLLVRTYSLVQVSAPMHLIPLATLALTGGLLVVVMNLVKMEE